MRLFRSDRLERLTMVTPRAFAATWAGVLALVLWTGWGAVGLPTGLALVAAGLLGWSLFEYVMHRFVFHLKLRSEIGRRFVFTIHGNHHDNPDDAGRSIMPLVVSLPWSGAIWALLVLALGGAGSPVFLGFAIGYVAYDAVHYACHQLPVRGRLLRALRRHHLRHHFGREEGDYAITAIFWDRVFGTHVSAEAAAGTGR